MTPHKKRASYSLANAIAQPFWVDVKWLLIVCFCLFSPADPFSQTDDQTMWPWPPFVPPSLPLSTASLPTRLTNDLSHPLLLISICYHSVLLNKALNTLVYGMTWFGNFPCFVAWVSCWSLQKQVNDRLWDQSLSRKFSQCSYEELICVVVLMRLAGQLKVSLSLLWKHRFTKRFSSLLFALSRWAWIPFRHLPLHRQMSTTLENGMGGFSNTSREKTYKKVCEKTGTKKNRTSVPLFRAWFYMSLVGLPELAWKLSWNVTWEKSPQVLT